MSTDNNENIHVTAEGIILFPSVFEPKPIMKNGKALGEPFYSCNLLLSPEAVKETWAKAVAVARAHFGASVDLKSIRMPVQSGTAAKVGTKEEGKAESFYDGMFVLHARSDFATGVLDLKSGEEVLKGTTLANKVRSGNYGHLEVTFRAYDGVSGGQAGVKAYLNNLLVTREGKPIAGKTVKDAFAGIISKKSEVAVDDDQIPY